jgi:hypothetical protein
MEATIKPAGRRRIVTLATAILVIMIVGIAYAAWTADGTGQGYAQAGDIEELRTTNVATVDLEDPLYPDRDADVRLTIHNDNPFNVVVSDINNDPAGDISSDNTACNSGGHEVSFEDQGVDIVIEENSSVNVTLEDAASMGFDSDDNCRTAKFTIDVELLGESTDRTDYYQSDWTAAQ